MKTVITLRHAALALAAAGLAFSGGPAFAGEGFNVAASVLSLSPRWGKDILACGLVRWRRLDGSHCAAMKKAPPPLAIIRARRMRREPTLAEAAMWRLLRAHFSEWRFRRQVPLGHAICDFASHRARLVIEIDGGQHGGAADVARDAMIGCEGYRVVRFWNNEVLGNIEGVARVLSGVLDESALRLHSPPSSANSPPSNFG